MLQIQSWCRQHCSYVLVGVFKCLSYGGIITLPLVLVGVCHMPALACFAALSHLATIIFNPYIKCFLCKSKGVALLLLQKMNLQL